MSSFCRIIKYRIRSAGNPSFSYMARKKNGSMRATMMSADACVPNTPFVKM